MQKTTDSSFIKLKYLLLIILCAFAYKYAIVHWISVRFNWEESNTVLFKAVKTNLVLVVWLLFIPIMLRIKNRFPLSKENKRFRLLHVFLSIGVAIFIEGCSDLLDNGFIYFFVNHKFDANWEKYTANFEIFMMNINYGNIVIYWMFIIYFSGLDYYKKYKDESLKRVEAESLIAKAELNALKMQIQPHFLFNTLNSITSLIDEDTEEAQDMVGRLGELLRYTLDQKHDFIPLKTELEFIENYLEIEQIRFKERLITHYSIAPNTSALFLPSFILQPLIENSIKHGLSKTNKPCTINIASKQTNGMLEITIMDDGKGSETIVKGIGIENTENSRYFLMKLMVSG